MPVIRFRMSDLLAAEITLQGSEGGRLAPAGRFPCGADIGYMKVGQVTEGVQAGYGRSVGRQSPIGRGLGLTGPFPGVVAAQECLARVAALSSDLDPVGTGGKAGDRGHFRVRYVCSESS